MGGTDIQEYYICPAATIPNPIHPYENCDDSVVIILRRHIDNLLYMDQWWTYLNKVICSSNNLSFKRLGYKLTEFCSCFLLCFTFHLWQEQAETHLYNATTKIERQISQRRGLNLVSQRGYSFSARRGLVSTVKINKIKAPPNVTQSDSNRPHRKSFAPPRWLVWDHLFHHT